MPDSALDLIAAMMGFVPAVIVCGLFVLHRHRLICRMREHHAERWSRIGIARHLAHPARFGAFLFDPHDFEGDPIVRDLKRRVLVSMSASLIGLASVRPWYLVYRSALERLFRS